MAWQRFRLSLVTRSDTFNWLNALREVEWLKPHSIKRLQTIKSRSREEDLSGYGADIVSASLASISMNS